VAPTLSLDQARRLALHAQGLAVPPAAGTRIADVVARIGCLQLDPVGVVARSPLLVLRARLNGGTHDSHERALRRAAYPDRELFDYWCHEASHCHVGDLPLHRWAMRTYVERLGPSRDDVRKWLAENAGFADHTVAALEAAGPLRARRLEDRSEVAWELGHWTDEVSSRQTIARMLDKLWMQGRIGISDRAGTERRWDVLERCLPAAALAEADAAPLSENQVVRRAIVRAVGMLGVARGPHIAAHFTRRRYPGMGGAGTGVIGELERAGELTRVAVAGLRGDWWALPAELERLSRLEPGRRTLALSPFDNLLCDRSRTAELFGFDHRLEIYVPAGKRRWGYYVLPILRGERLIARADLRLDRQGERPVLRTLAVHHEPGRRAPRAVERALESLARWRGAEPAHPGTTKAGPLARARPSNPQS
jgi:uncharacterized protein YcaQ